MDSKDPPTRAFRIAESLVLALPISWLVVAAAWVAVDYYDSFDSIANALYFLGESDEYVASRGPLMGVLLAPAVAAQRALALHPLDLRPVHATVAILNTVQLLGVYALLAGHFGRRWETLLAFAAAIPCFLFFSYGAFVSHDVLAGGAMLWMLVAAARFLERPDFLTWSTLVFVGAAAALLKHTWAMCWIATLIAAVTQLEVAGKAERRLLVRRTAALAIGAAASGLIAWMAIARVTESQWPESAFWLRPVDSIRHLLFGLRPDLEVPAWIYLRNAAAFGPLAVAALVPGLVLAWRSDHALERMVAIATVLLLLVLHALGLREVRYGFVLAPLLAFLAVRPFAWTLQRRWGGWALAAGLLLGIAPIHPYSIGSEALRIAQPFYRTSEVRSFLQPLETTAGLRGPVYGDGRMLSTTPPQASPLAADVYHRIFHFAFRHLRTLYGYDRTEALSMRVSRLRALDRWPDDAAILTSSGSRIVNPLTWTPDEPLRKYSLRQSLLLAELLDLQPRADGSFESASGERVSVRLEAERIVLEGPGVSPLSGVHQLRLLAGTRVLGRASHAARQSVSFDRDPANAARSLSDLLGGEPALEVRFFREVSRIAYSRADSPASETDPTAR